MTAWEESRSSARPVHPYERREMNRRSFLTGMAGILAAGVAPSVLPSGIIMPIRKLWTPSGLRYTIQGWLNGEFTTERGTVEGSELSLPESLRFVDFIGIYNKAGRTIDCKVSIGAIPLMIGALSSEESMHYERGRGFMIMNSDGGLTRI